MCDEVEPSAGPRNTHLATLRPSAWRSDRSSPRRGDAAMENAIVVSVCTRARHECESARARTLTGDLDDKVSRTRRRSGRLSMNRSHFRTVAMKISRFGFKKQKNTRSNLPQTSRPGTLSADTSFPASSSLERLASRTQKKKARSGLDFVTVLFITHARASERRRASSRLSIRHNAGARDAVLRSHRHAFEATDGFANAFVRGVFVRDGATHSSSDLR